MTTSVLRPIGFRPEEISALINEVVVDQHAEEAAFLWSQRDRAVTAPNFRLKDLARLDERVEAHLDGLRVAAEYGWKVCEEALEEPQAGELFAAGILAFGSGKPDCINKMLDTAAANPGTVRGLASALAWLSFGAVERILVQLASSERSPDRCLAIAGYALHRRDPGPPLQAALSSADPMLRARALKACGELGKTAALPAILKCLTTDHAPSRFWAAWAAARLGDRSASLLGTLRQIADTPGPYSQVALDIGLRISDLATAKEWYAQLRGQPGRARIAAIAAGVIGDPALMPDLLQLMKTPAAARRAGAAFSMITGVDLAYADLDSDPPPDFQAPPSEIPEVQIEADLDANLRWPAPELVAAWWKKNASTFASGKRYLFGKEFSEASCRKTLLKGYQPQRAAAALELGLRQPSQPLFEVRAAANQQTKSLQAWSS